MDLVELGFSVDTRDIDRGINKLDKLEASEKKVGAEAKKSGGLIAKSFEEGSQSLDKASKSGTGLTNVMAGIGGALAGIGLTGLVADAFSTFRAFESMNASLKTVTGSATAAASAFAEIKEFATTTPYTLDQSVEGFQKLKALGLDPSMTALRSYGNTAAAMGKDLSQMIEAVADASTGEFERLKEFGIKSKSEGDQVSFTFQGITTTIGKNSTEIQEYLRGIGDVQFATAMADKMDTIDGKIANLSDSYAALQVQLMQSGGAAIAEAGISSLSAMIVSITENTRLYVVGLSALALFMTRNMITAGVSLIANQSLVALSFARTNLQALAQVPSMGKAAVAMNIATGAARGLAGVMALIGGPVGLLVIAAASAFAYKDEIRELTSGVKMSKEQEEQRIKVLADVKRLSEEATGATKELSASKRKDAEASYQASQAELARLKTLAAASRQRFEAAKAAESAEKAQGLSIRYRSTENLEAATMAAKNANAEYQAQLDLVREIDKELKNFGKQKVTIQGVNVESGVTSGTFKAPKVGTVDQAAKDAQRALQSIRTDQEKYNDSIAQYSEWLKAGNIDTAEHTKLVSAAQAQLAKSNATTVKAISKSKELTSEQRQAIDASKRAQQANKLAQESLGKTDEQIRALTLSYKDGYTPELAKSQARAEFAKKADDALADSKEKLRIQNKRDKEELSEKNKVAREAVELTAGTEAIYKQAIADDSLGQITRKVEALNLVMSGKFNEAQAKNISNNKHLISTYKDIKAALEGVKSPTSALTAELENLNSQWISGKISATEYHEAITDAVDKSKTLVKDAKKVAEELEQNTKTMSKDLVSAINSSLLDGDFRSLGDKLNDLFADDVFGPILNGSLKSFGSAFANSMKGLANSISGALGGTDIFADVGKGLSSLLSNDKIKESFSQIDFSGALDAAFENSGIGSTIGGIAGSFFGPAGSAAGSALGSIIESAFGGKAQTVNSGVQLSYAANDGLSGSNFEDKSKKKSFWRGTKYWTELSALDKDIDDSISRYFDTINSSMAVQAALFGKNADNMLSGFVMDAQKFSGEDIGAQVQEWAEQTTADMYDIVFSKSLGKFQQTGEEMSNTVSRLLVEIDSVIGGLGQMGVYFRTTTKNLAVVADGLVQAAGGLDILKANMQSYYDVVFTADEQTALQRKAAKKEIDAFNESLGLTGVSAIDTVEELKEFVDSQNHFTKEGQEAKVAAFALAASIATYSGTAEEAAEETAALAAEVEALGSAADQSLNLISTLADELYGSIDQRYATELARYEALKNGANDLRDAVNGFTDSVSGTQGTLADSQRSYNDLLAKAQSGDTSVIPELMTAADSLRSALSENYAGGSQAVSGTSLISGQLSQVASLLDLSAGESPIDPSATDNRTSLAQDLANEIASLGLAQDTSVFDLMSANGIYLKDLADDFGVNIGDMNADNLGGLSELANSLGVDSLVLASKLGVSVDDLASHFGVDISGVTDGINTDISSLIQATKYQGALDRYAINQSKWLINRAINGSSESASESAKSISENISNQVDSSALVPYLSAIEGATDFEGLNIAVNDLLTSNSEALSDLLEGFGVNLDKLDSTTLKGLSSLSSAFNTDIVSLGGALGLSIKDMGGLISSELVSQSGSLPADIKSGLTPYLSAIETASDSSGLLSAIVDTSNYFDGLSGSLGESFNSDISWLVNATKYQGALDRYAINQSKWLINQAINGSTDSASESAKNIADNIANQVDSDVLVPYLNAIEGATDFEGLNAAVNDLLDSNSAGFDVLLDGFGVNLEKLDATTLDGLSSLSKAFNTDIGSLSLALGLSVDDIGKLIASGSQSSAGIISEALVSMSNELGISFTDLAIELGASLSDVQSSIFSQISAVSGISEEVKSGLSDYAKSVLTADNSEAMLKTLGQMASYVDNLPEGIQAELNSQLLWLGSLSRANVEETYNLNESVKDKLFSLAKSIGFDFDHLINSNIRMSDSEISYLHQLALVTNRTSAETAGLLGIKLENYGKSLAESISSKTSGLSSDITSSLAPYLDALANAETAAGLDAAYDSLNGFMSTLPRDIRNQLMGHLDGIASSAEATTAEIVKTNGIISAIENSAKWISSHHVHLRTLISDTSLAERKWLQNINEAVGGRSNVNSFDVGSDRIHGDQLAQIHDGESIFTAAESDGLRKSVGAIMSRLANEPQHETQPTTVNLMQAKTDKSDELMQKMIDELKATKAEIKEMKEDQKIVSREINKNVRDSSRTLDRWETIGLPLERTE